MRGLEVVATACVAIGLWFAFQPEPDLGPVDPMPKQHVKRMLDIRKTLRDVGVPVPRREP